MFKIILTPEEVMEEKLIQEINDALVDFNCLAAMHEANKHVLRKMNMYEIPELSKSFNTGVVYATILNMINMAYFPNAPPTEILNQSQMLILKFLSDGYKSNPN